MRNGAILRGRDRKSVWSWHDYATSVLLRRYGYITVPVFLLSLLAGIVMYAKYTKQLHESAESTSQNIRPQSHPVYDAIIVPGGGLYKDGKPHTFVQARLEKPGHLDTTPSISSAVKRHYARFQARFIRISD